MSVEDVAAALPGVSFDVSPRGVTPRLGPSLEAALQALVPADAPQLAERLAATGDIAAAFVWVRALVGLGVTPSIPDRWHEGMPSRRELLRYAGVEDTTP